MLGSSHHPLQIHLDDVNLWRGDRRGGEGKREGGRERLSYLMYTLFPPPLLRMSKVAMEASKKPIRPEVRNLVLEICCTDSSGEDAEVPYIKYNFR